MKTGKLFSRNEKWMIVIILLLILAILSRWSFVSGEIAEAFGNIFGGSPEPPLE